MEKPSLAVIVLKAETWRDTARKHLAELRGLHPDLLPPGTIGYFPPDASFRRLTYQLIEVCGDIDIDAAPLAELMAELTSPERPARPDYGEYLTRLWKRCGLVLAALGCPDTEEAGRPVPVVSEPAPTAGVELKAPREPKPEEADDSSWVAASKLCPDKGVALKTARAFCEKHKIRFRKPSPQRLEIHAGEWAEYWAGRDVEQFKKLDQTGTPSVFGREDIVVKGAAERLRQLQAKKRGGK